MISKKASPLSLPDFSGVKPDLLMAALRKCEEGRAEEVLQEFESDFCTLTRAKYCIAVSSATSGLHLAMLALGIGKDDCVICPTFTFAASAFPVLYQQATPVFVDSETDTWNMSPHYLKEAIETLVKKGKTPKAIVTVHSYGTPAKTDEILEMAGRYDIPVIEDAANALGSTFNGKQAGTMGRLGVFSFNRNKIITAGAGGCVVTNEENLAAKIRYYAHQAKSDSPFYLHEKVGYNYGLSPVLAEIIRLQFPFLTERVIERRKFFFHYTYRNYSGTYQKETDQSFSNRWLTVLKPDDKQIFSGSETGPVWKPLHTQSVFSPFPYFGNNESQDFFDHALCLPFRKM